MLNYQLKKVDLYLVAVILFLGLVIRFFYLADFAGTDTYNILPYSDGSYYLNWAKDIAAGDILGGNKAFLKWPLYGYFLALLLRVFGENIALVYALQFVLGAINCVMVYFIGRELFGRAVGFIAALMCLSYGMFLYYEGAPIYTSLSVFLNSLLFLLFLRLREKPTGRAMFWTGAFCGICALTQANILFFAPLAAFWVLWINRREKLKFTRGLIVFLAGLGLVIGISTLRNYIVEIDFVPMTGHVGVNFYLGNNPDSTGLFFSPEEITADQQGASKDTLIIATLATGRQLKTSEVSRFWMSKALSFIKDHPAAELKLLLKKTAYLFSPWEATHDSEFHLIAGDIRIFKVLFLNLNLIMPFFLLGLFLGLKDLRKNALLYLVFIALSLSIVLFSVCTRYRMAVVPFMSLFAAYALCQMVKSLSGKRLIAFWLMAAALTAITILLNLSSRLYPADSAYMQYRGHLQRALLYKDKQDYLTALVELKNAGKLRPNGRLYLFTLGDFYYDMEKFSLAEQTLKKAIELYPFYADAYYNLGLLYNKEGRSSDAADILEKLLRLDPQDAPALFELGRAYKNMGRDSAAKVEFERALKNIGRGANFDREMIKKELDSLNK